MNTVTIDKSTDQDNFLAAPILLIFDWMRQGPDNYKNIVKIHISYNLHFAASNCKGIIVFNTPKKSPVSKIKLSPQIKRYFSANGQEDPYWSTVRQFLSFPSYVLLGESYW